MDLAKSSAIILAEAQFRPSGEGWKSMPELPTGQEICDRQVRERVAENPVDKAWDSKDAYLRAQYEITRCEGTDGLRSSVGIYRDALAHGVTMMDDGLTCVYTKVFVNGFLFSRVGPIFRVSFSTERSQFKVNWQQSRRLTPGTIVAITTKADQFETICKIATIAQRPFLGGLDQNPPLVDLLWAQPEDAVFDPSEELVMVESRNSYFEATRHTLVGLQKAADTESPLDKYLMSVHNIDKAPTFVEENPIMNLSSIVNSRTGADNSNVKQQLTNFDVLANRVLDFDTTKNHTTLDKSQLEGIDRILTKELAIVQGPPGTGKTFTSVEALKILIKRRRQFRGRPGLTPPPIIVAAQTNHAVDQLLMLCLNADAKILRLGRRMENEEMLQYTPFHLRNSKRAKIRNLSMHSGDASHKALKREHEANIDEIKKLLGQAFGRKFLSVDTLLEYGVITAEQHEALVEDLTGPDGQRLDPMELWLQDVAAPGHLLRDTVLESVDMNDEIHALNLPDEQEEVEKENQNGVAEVDDLEDGRIVGEWVAAKFEVTGKIPFGLGNYSHVARRLLRKSINLWEIEPYLRGAIYRLLQQRLLAKLTEKLKILLAKNAEICNKFTFRMHHRNRDLVVSLDIDVVGCTTTGLSKYRGFLASLQSTTLLIEEASLTREASVTAALFPSIEQLILIGDHRQLAPNVSVSWLAGYPHYIDVSLFERMIKLNMPYVMLKQQRRMAPELRHILNPFYPELSDHPSVVDVERRPLVPGMGPRRCWFFDHSWPEREDWNQSRINHEEAHMVVEFFAYLASNGTDPMKITILTFYQGQRKVILAKLRRHAAITADEFNVFTVDSYQGEENDIVLLSLVRSPRDKNGWAVGFMEDSRRAVVAISRARRGLYVFGNVDNMLKANHQSREVWGQIWNGFAEQLRVKRTKGLPIICQQHQRETWIKKVRDWSRSPSGCDLPCNQMRTCGHKCTLKCHAMDHRSLPCNEACLQKLQCGHGCEKHCSLPCFCRCDEFATAMEMKRQQQRRENMTLQERLLDMGARPNPVLLGDKWDDYVQSMSAKKDSEAPSAEQPTQSTVSQGTLQSTPAQTPGNGMVVIRDHWRPVILDANNGRTVGQAVVLDRVTEDTSDRQPESGMGVLIDLSIDGGPTTNKDAGDEASSLIDVDTGIESISWTDAPSAYDGSSLMDLDVGGAIGGASNEMSLMDLDIDEKVMSSMDTVVGSNEGGGAEGAEWLIRL